MPGAPTVSPTRRTAPTRPAGPRRPTLWPAMLVLGLAVVILVVFAVAASVTSSPHRAAGPSSPRSVRVDGRTIRAEPAAGVISPIVTLGQPPRDIVGALSVPAGTWRVAARPNPQEAGQYDRSVNLAWRGSQARLIGFYRADLTESGWKIESAGPARSRGAFQILARRGGSDGWYWRAAVVVSPTAFPGPPTGTATGTATGSGSATTGSASPAPRSASSGIPAGGTSSTGVTPFSLELTQESDEF